MFVDLPPYLDLQSQTLSIAAWKDAVVDVTGHDPRSPYVERFWLGVLGPSATWLIRTIAYGFDVHPDGFQLPIDDTARMLGLGARHGRHSPFARSIIRLCQFDLAIPRPDGTLLVRAVIPWVSRRQRSVLPAGLQHEHSAWEAADDGLDRTNAEQMRQRANRAALALVESGQDLAQVEQALMRWRFHSTLVRSCSDWAWQHHYGVAPERSEVAPEQCAPWMLGALTDG